jgi:hypothetical protein
VVWRHIDSLPGRKRTKREELHRLDTLDVAFKNRSGVRLLHLRDLSIDLRGENAPDKPGTDKEITFERNPKPASELLGITDGTPDAVARHTKQDLLLSVPLFSVA